MQGNPWRTAGLAGVLAITGIACAGTQRQETTNPTAQAVQAQQKQSQEALDRAHDAQKKASDQEHKAAQAQQDVQKAQQALIDAQQKARREQAKAEQLQRDANALTAQATRQAQQSQHQAVQSLAQQGQQVQQGHLTTAGEVVAASGDQLVLQPRTGDRPITFRITDQTNVRIDGQPASVADVQQGVDARVSYQTTGSMQPEALTVDVGKGGSPPAGTSPQSPQGTPPDTTSPGTLSPGTTPPPTPQDATPPAGAAPTR